MENTKNLQKSSFEIGLLYILFYFPGIVAMRAANFNIFDSWMYHFIYLSHVLPQITLVLYFVYLSKGNWQDFGIRPLTFKILPMILLSYFALLGAVFLSSFVLHPFLGEDTQIVWKISHKALYLPLALSSLATGYSEELFFRSFIFSKLNSCGIHQVKIYAVSAILFSLGHLYQGLAAFFVSGVLGIILLRIFEVKKNLHVVAISHALYNFSVVLASNSLLNL